MIRENIGYKLLALAIAIVIWLYVNDLQPTTDSTAHRNGYITKKFTVPLSVRKADRSFVVTGAPREVETVLEGRLDDMRALAEQQDDISAYISLLGRRAGVHVLPVIVKLPEEFTGLIRRSSETHAVTVTLEEKIRREFKIQVDLSGSPQPGYQYKQPEVQPSKAFVFGPEMEVDRVERLVVTADQGSAGSLGIDDTLPIRALDHNGQVVLGVELSRNMVHVRLLPLVTPLEKTVLISPSTIGQTPYPYKVVGMEVQPQTVSITGSPDKLAGVGILETEPIVLANKKQTFTQKVRIVTPEGVTLSKGDSADVTVRIVTFGKQSEPSATSVTPSKPSGGTR